MINNFKADAELESVSIIIMLAVVVLFFAVVIILFHNYFKYYKKCVDNRLVDDEIREMLMEENKKFFKNNAGQGKNEISLFSDYLVHKEEKKRRLKWLSIVGDVLFYGIVLMFVLLIIFAESGGKLPYVGGKSGVVVITGSMETVEPSNTYIANHKLNNQIHHHSFILLEEVDSEEDIKLYDIIVYKDDDGRNIVHRVIDIKNLDGKTLYTCRGDANNVTADFERNMSFDRILGKYSGFQNYPLGIFITFVRSTVGIIAVAAAFIIAFFFEGYDKKIDIIVSTRKPEIVEQIDDELRKKYEDTEKLNDEQTFTELIK